MKELLFCRTARWRFPGSNIHPCQGTTRYFLEMQANLYFKFESNQNQMKIQSNYKSKGRNMTFSPETPFLLRVSASSTALSPPETRRGRFGVKRFLAI
jgi:hypothetical protein